MNRNRNEPTANPDNFLPTRRTLISKLRDWENDDSWQEFFDTYWKLIFSVALKSGLTHPEAEEVVQETIVSIAKKMDSFEYDPDRCSFKGWLKHMTRLRILDQFRKRKPGDQAFARTEKPSRQPDTGASDDPVDQLADSHADALEQIWEREWEDNLIELTLQRIKTHVRPEHYQIFYMNVVQGRSCREVAQLVGTTVSQVYVVRHRVGKLAKQERNAIVQEQENAARGKRPQD